MKKRIDTIAQREEKAREGKKKGKEKEFVASRPNPGVSLAKRDKSARAKILKKDPDAD